jgi:hypothetical protein
MIWSYAWIQLVSLRKLCCHHDIFFQWCPSLNVAAKTFVCSTLYAFIVLCDFNAGWTSVWRSTLFRSLTSSRLLTWCRRSMETIAHSWYRSTKVWGVYPFKHWIYFEQWDENRLLFCFTCSIWRLKRRDFPVYAPSGGSNHFYWGGGGHKSGSVKQPSFLHTSHVFTVWTGSYRGQSEKWSPVAPLRPL